MQYCFETYNRAPLDMYNGLSQVVLSKRKEDSISIQKVKLCVNLSGSKPSTPQIILAASLAIQKNMAAMFGLFSWYM